MNYQWIDEYAFTKQGIHKDYKKEWDWNRYLLNEKLVLAVCHDKEGKDIVTLKCEPSFAIELRSQHEGIVEGYYMNKTHWSSVYLDGSVPDEVIKIMIDQSYELILKSFSKKKQRDITGVVA